ncbi:hypothetical protein F441_02119 [Phytophthora nicotianae CJ01A1]|uniref:Uncharacterized protein n=3 Tax=Phytophthora nicotianae TaxID=4792 RepID=W3A090_PHYNI|nr:hypothetical protein F441_02119 [Phytophthora nicotianae CJ01A1]ETP52948.1 hypothetical protein F442_02107 [Phytophthora nicotianae P10297]
MSSTSSPVPETTDKAVSGAKTSLEIALPTFEGEFASWEEFGEAFDRDSAGFPHREELDGLKRGRWREALDCWDLRTECGRVDCLRLRLRGRTAPGSVDDCCMCFVEECSTKLYILYIWRVEC